MQLEKCNREGRRERWGRFLPRFLYCWAFMQKTNCVCPVPEGALQNRHAAPLQVAQLHESHFLRPLWESAVGSGQTGPQVWRCGGSTFSMFGCPGFNSFIHFLFVFVDCAMNVHHKCQDKVANLCGINQKLLAEALTQVSQVRSGVGHTSCVDYRQHLFISTQICSYLLEVYGSVLLLGKA